MNPAGGGNHPTYRFLIEIVKTVQVVQIVEVVNGKRDTRLSVISYPLSVRVVAVSHEL